MLDSQGVDYVRLEGPEQRPERLRKERPQRRADMPCTSPEGPQPSHPSARAQTWRAIPREAVDRCTLQLVVDHGRRRAEQTHIPADTVQLAYPARRVNARGIGDKENPGCQRQSRAHGVRDVRTLQLMTRIQKLDY